MNDDIRITLIPSKTYLTLSFLVHVLILFAIWQYIASPWLGILIALPVVVHWYQLNQKILLLKADCAKSIHISNGAITITQNDRQIKQYPQFYCAYQSQLLVIISAGKASFVIFKDAVNNQSLSSLNKLCNAKR